MEQRKLASEVSRRARALRREPTADEDVAWHIVRGGLLGPRFLRQQALGLHTAGPSCPAARLVIQL